MNDESPCSMHASHFRHHRIAFRDGFFPSPLLAEATEAGGVFARTVVMSAITLDLTSVMALTSW